MLYYLTVAGIVLHAYFWGTGLAWLALPRVWRRWGWAFAPGFGVALQSAVVWAGVHTPLMGTDRYAWFSEAIPAALLAAVVWRAGLAATLLRWRHLRGLAGVALVMIAAGWLLVSPMTRLGRGLTTSSLGSCDQADYAAGARVLKEFAASDRTGFLGLSEVTRVHGAHYFVDYWKRLNHFTPAALIAHNGTIFGAEPHRLVGVTAAALLLLNLPVVLFLARVAVGLRGWSALAVTAIYGLSPLGGYAVHVGGLGQLLATHGIALVTLATLGACRVAERRPILRDGMEWRLAPFAGLAFIGFWVMVGSYNFVVTIALAPALAWLVGRCVWRRDVRSLWPVLAVLAAALAACAAVFWGRFAGLVERFWLFGQYDFGWAVPTLTPEGWLGLVATPELQSWPLAFRLVASAVLVGAAVWAGARLWRRQPDQMLAALAFVLPVAVGWAFLTWQTRVRANASYDAFKLLAVFYPGLLAGLCVWLRLADDRNIVTRCLVAALALTVLTGNLVTTDLLRERMQNPPLRVDRPLVELARLERNERIGSLNMKIDEFWSRLWANAFLLKKPQYFPTHTYEARKNTPLKGTWDLRDSLLRGLPAGEADFVVVNARFHAVRRAAPGFVEVQFGDGWHALERHGADRWRWDRGDGVLLLQNPAAAPVHARLTLKARAISLRQITLKINQTVAGKCVLDEKSQDIVFPDIVVPPGQATLILASSEPARQATAGDPRSLSVCLYGLELRALGGDAGPAPK